ncbi:hypothetical protein BDM02DRAFT_3132113 [Thelephora ganbajun]|uniref:Uncharacterized protein n=1 Tax=Thelephora ganbajun TaxID=370292 RepID=A0ACB6Z2W8_THEGA|nr:hypothetical protein BDM02DRAFT_3132113 [Thelephora ganbajun]
MAVEAEGIKHNRIRLLATSRNPPRRLRPRGFEKSQRETCGQLEGYKAIRGAVDGDLGVRRGLPHLGLKLVSEAQFFPYVTSFADKNIKDEGHFSYEGHTDSDPKGNKVVFIANTEGSQEVVVKFIEAYYNETAHCLLTARGLAPPLCPCDQFIPSDFTMAVMDYVDGKQLFPAYRIRIFVLHAPLFNPC